MTKLCPRGKAAAKRKFAVYPSAYANAYASKICAGKIKDPSGTKRKDFRGPKPAGAKVGMAVTAGSQSGMGRLEKSGLMKAASGDMAKIIKVVKSLKKASKTHGKQAKTLKTIRANKGLHAETKKKKPTPGGRDRHEYLRKKQNPNSYYDKKGKLKYTFAKEGAIMDKKRDIRKVEHMTGKNENKFKDMRGKKKPTQMKTGGICRGGGAAIRGLNFQGLK